MAVEISNGTTVPHATSHTDLLDKLVTFVQTVLANAVPTAPTPSNSAAGTALAAGTYEVVSTDVNIYGETSKSTMSSIVLVAGDKLTMASFTLPANVTTRKYYVKVPASGNQLYAVSSTGAAVDVTVNPSGAIAPTVNTSGAWSILEDAADKTVFKGKGSGSDEIIVALQLYNAGWRITGYTGYVSGQLFAAQPGAIPSACGSLALWTNPIQYWFVVNSRRIIVVAKVNTTYHAMYAGWFLPYATPGQYPYPMFIGGDNSTANYGNAPAYNDISNNSVNFWRHSISDYPVYYMRQNNIWRQLVNQQSAAPLILDNGQGLYPYIKDLSNSGGATANMGSNTLNVRRLTLDGKDVLEPISLVHRVDGIDKGWAGELDGVFSITGNAHVAEDIVTYGGSDHLLVNNVYRSGTVDFATIKLA